MLTSLQHVMPKMYDAKRSKSGTNFPSTLTREEFQTFSQCLNYEDKSPMLNCDKLLRERMVKLKTNTLYDFKPQKKLINDQIRANPKEFYKQKEKAFVQTLDVINHSLIPHFHTIIEEKRPQYEDKEFYRYKCDKLQGLMTNMMEFLRLTNQEANFVNNSNCEKKAKITKFIDEMNSPKKREIKKITRQFECHYKDCVKMYNSRGALRFHMKTKHDKKSDQLKEDYINKQSCNHGCLNSCDSHCYFSSYTIPTRHMSEDFVNKNEEQVFKLERTKSEVIIPTHVREDVCFEETNGYDTTIYDESTNVFSLQDFGQPCFQEEINNFIELNCKDNQLQKNPFFIGFEEDEIDHFSIVQNDKSFSEKDETIIHHRENGPVFDGFLTADEGFDNDSF